MTFGRAPLAFYIAHLYLVHIAAWLPPSGSRRCFPPGSS